MKDSTDPKEWIRRARMDLRSAANDINDDPDQLAEIICYNSHQACENALKGFLLYNGEAPPHSHDLLLLLERSRDYAPNMAQLRDIFVNLNPFNLAVRYPGDIDLNAGATDALKVLEDARFVVDSVEKHLNKR